MAILILANGFRSIFLVIFSFGEKEIQNIVSSLLICQSYIFLIRYKVYKKYYMIVGKSMLIVYFSIGMNVLLTICQYFQ